MIEDDYNSNSYLACMSINLIHETAHTFGLDDRYDEYDHPQDGFQCVMEDYPLLNYEALDFYEKVSSGNADAFCANCAYDLNNEIATNLVIGGG